MQEGAVSDVEAVHGAVRADGKVMDESADGAHFVESESSSREPTFTKADLAEELKQRRWYHELDDLELLEFVFIVVSFGIFAAFRTSLTPHTREFFVNDARYWNTRRESTVPAWEVFVIAGALCAIPPILELILRPPYRTKKRALLIAARIIVSYITQGLVTLFATEALKVAIGGLRPDFASLCLGAANVPPSAYNTTVILSDAECTPDPDVTAAMLRDARLSFPSGHTSGAFAYAFFMTFYIVHISVRLRPAWAMSLVQLIATAPIVYAGYVGASRLNDNKHHFIDVVGGGLIAMFFAMIFFAKTMRGIQLKVPELEQHTATGSNSKYLRNCL